MITKNNILFESDKITGSVSKTGELYIPPAPFANHATNVTLEDCMEKVHVPVMFTKALLSWMTFSTPLAVYSPEHAAVGTKSSGKEYPYVYAEFQADVTKPVDCIAYDANTGIVKGFRYNEVLDQPDEFNVTGDDLEDGVAVWMAILAVYSSERETNISWIGHKIEDGLIDDAWKGVAEVFKEVRELLYSDPSLLNFGEEGNATLELLPVEKVLNGSIGPTPGNLILGKEMKVFGARRNEDLSLENQPEVRPEEYADIPWARDFDSLTPEEQLLVPRVDKNHIVTTEEIDVLNDIKRTASKGETRRISNILLVGAAGTGKTESVRFWGSILRRPVVTQTMSAYTSEDDIRGTILMHLDGEEVESSSMSDEDKKVYKAIVSCEDDALMTDRVAEAMGLPTIAEAYFDPAGTIETLTGVADESADEFKARDALETLVSAEVRKVCAEAKNAAKADGSVHYRYIPSPIVKAIENGYILEIQEPSNVIQQGVLSSLYDVLEKASVGTLTLPHKTIRRHPDFMCVMTTNTDYPGCKPLSPALISRMQEQILLNDLSRETLVQRVLSRTDITDVSLATKIVDVYLAAKEKGEELGSMGEATPRSLYTFADAVSDGEDPLRAFKRFLLGAVTLNADDQADVLLAVEDCELFN